MRHTFGLLKSNSKYKFKLQAALNGPSHPTQLGEPATRAVGSHSPRDTRGVTIVASWPDWLQSKLYCNIASDHKLRL